MRLLDPDTVLAEVPNTPVTLEFRAIARQADSQVYRSGGGLLLVDAGRRLLGAMGDVEPRDAANLLQRCQLDCELLADSRAYRALRAEMEFERAQISTLAAPWQALAHVVAGLTIRPLKVEDSLDQLPQDLRAEIAAARGKSRVLAGFIGGVAVSFAYSLTTETLADLSIDTIEAHRRRGIGRAVISAHIDELVTVGLAPVWGAVESNVASLRLAEALGFTVAAGELFVSDSPC